MFGLDFDFSLGLDYASDAGLDLFPSVVASKEFVKDVLLVSLGLEDNKYRNTYKSLSDKNPFIHTLGTNQNIIFGDTLLNLQTSETKQFFCNIKNLLGYNDVWDASISYGFVENLAYFDNNYQSDYNRFIVYYADAWQLFISSAYEREINQILHFNINAEYYHWSNVQLAHKPNLFIYTSFPINLRDKIICKPVFQYFGKQIAIAQNETQLGSIFHFNLSIEYYYSSTLSTYFLLNNLTNSKNEIWRDYKQMGFNGVFGLSYSF